MGLVSELLLLPLAPVRGVKWLAGVVEEQAELERDGSRSVPERLAAIERAYDAGEISARRREELEQRLLDEIAGSDGG